MSIRGTSGSAHMFRRQIRLIYLHKGPRVAGIRRDPELVLKTNGGLNYGSKDALSPVKAFLLEKFAVPEDMVLQALTHKSFGNGITPFNEKLVVMGLKLMNLFLAKHVVNQETSNENAINGKNLDVLGTPIAKELGGKMALGLFAKWHKLNSNMFWKSHNHDLTFVKSGEMKVSAHMMYALVGAVSYVHGKKAAEDFVREKLLANKPSLEEITEKLLEQGEQEE